MKRKRMFAVCELSEKNTVKIATYRDTARAARVACQERTDFVIPIGYGCK